MSENKHAHHITPLGVYIGIFLALMFFTAVTVGSAMLDLGWMNTPIALAIAGTKAFLVIWYFMEVRFARPLTQLAVLTGIIFFTLLLIFTFNDYIGRKWVENAQPWGNTLPYQK